MRLAKRPSAVMDNGSGIMLTSVGVKLVPTTYVRTFHTLKETYQASMSRHIMRVAKVDTVAGVAGDV